MDDLVSATTEIMVIEYTYKWNIKNFKFSCNRAAGKVINSPVFNIPNTKVKGCLKIYPGGESDQYKDYVSVYLELKSYEEADLLGEFQLWIPYGHTGDGSGRDSGLVNFSLEPVYGYPDYMKREYLINSKTLLPDEELCLMCQMKVSTGKVKCFEEHARDDKIMSVEMCLVEDWRQLLEKRFRTDVTFIIGDKRFEAHKLVLMARSEEFKSLFANRPDESEFEINDIPVEFMNDLLIYVYTGKINVIGLKLLGFFKVVFSYGLCDEGFEDECKRKILSQINNENAIDVLRDVWWNFTLRDMFADKCLKCISEHFKEIVHTKSFKDLLGSQSTIPIVHEILKNV